MLSFVLLAAPAFAGPERAAWMKDARWGLMTHYLADWKWRDEAEERSLPEGQWRTLGSPARWNEMVDAFDVEGLAQQLAEARVGYYLFTIGQNSGYYVAPNKTYDEIVGVAPSRCSRRDLVSDLADALGKRGIRLMVYLPTGAPNGDRTAADALEWRNGPHPNLQFRQKWERVVRDWSLRFGRKVSGWWFDGAYWPNVMYRGAAPNYETLAAAVRAGNPDAAVAICPSPILPMLTVSPVEDYTAGEVGNPAQFFMHYWPPRIHEGKVDGALLQMLSYLGRAWGRGAPRETPEQIVAWTGKVVREGGAVTWDIPVRASGLIAEPFLPHLRALSAAFSKGREDKAVRSTAAGTPTETQASPSPVTTPATPRAAWMQTARWGLMLRYVAEDLWRGDAAAKRTSEEWNAWVDAFEIEGLAGQLDTLRVPYVFITVGQASGFYLSPNEAYDRLVGVTPSRCARRDVVGELGAALAKRGIKLLVSLTSGAPKDDAEAVPRLEWKDGPHANLAFRGKWEHVVADWSRRWGTNVAGWWFDGVYWPNAMYRAGAPDFGTLAAAARTGNADAIVAFNPGPSNRVYSLTPHEDFLGGEVRDPANA
jgi:hypothetical protein